MTVGAVSLSVRVHEKGSTVPGALAEELRFGIPNAHLVMFDGGHLFFAFRERFCGAVSTFLGA